MKIRLFLPLLALVSIGCAAARPQPGHLRVMSYNIHHAAGEDGKVDVGRIAKIISDAHPDLVAIQEVDQGVSRSGRIDEPAELEKLTGMHAVFGKAIDFQGGNYGGCILSRFPVDSSMVYDLPTEKGREKRIAVAVYANAPEATPLIFLETHLDHQKPVDRLAQIKSILESVSTFNTGNVILAGDLNATAKEETIWTLHKSGWMNVSGNENTYPSTRPDRKIDWIFVGPHCGARMLEAHVLPETVASDHRPVVVDLEWKR